MNEEEQRILRRRIFLKEQAVTLIQEELEALKRRLALLDLRNSLVEKIGPDFDRETSALLDATDFLLRKL